MALENLEIEKEILKISKINLGGIIKVITFALPIKNRGSKKDQKIFESLETTA